jgi:uncharacterized membrane protein
MAAVAPSALLVKRNCSISPRAVLILLAITTFVSFGIGAAFAWHGLWLVLPFAGIEMAALTFAFYVNGLHAADYERFVIEGTELVLERRDGTSVTLHRFPTSWVQVVAQETRRDLRLALAMHGQELEIGRHLNAAGRALLATELRRWIRAGVNATNSFGGGAAARTV